MLRLFFRPDEWDAAAAASKAARLAALGGASEADAPEAAPGTPGFDVDAILAAASSALAGLEAPPAAAGGAHAKGADGGAGGAASSAGGGGGGGSGAKMMAVTVGAQFKTQLSELLTVVRATTPHYVRCLKPNAAQVPRQLERDSTVGQLRCGGVLEAVRVSLATGLGKGSALRCKHTAAASPLPAPLQVARLGYPVRTPHALFLRNYGFVGSRAASAAARALAKAGDAKGASASLVAHLVEALPLTPGTVQVRRRKAADTALVRLLHGPYLLLPPPHCQVGRNKVFFRKSAFDEVEAQRQRIMRTAAVRLQAAVRRMQGQKRYRAKRRLALQLQAIVRGHRGRRVATALRRERAAVVMQAFFRRSHARSRFLRLRKSVLRLQSFKRGAVARARVTLLRKHRAATFMAAAWRRHVARVSFLKKRKAAIRLQCAARGWHAQSLLARYKKEAKDVSSLRT